MATTVVSDGVGRVVGSQNGADRSIDVDEDGNLWFVHKNESDNNAEFWYSTDDGQTWNDSGARVAAADTGGMWCLHIDSDGYFHFAYELTGSFDDVKYVRGTRSGTSITWSSVLNVHRSSTGGVRGIACWGHPEGTGWKCHILYGAENDVIYSRVDITSDGTISEETQTTVSSDQPANALSIDGHHTGDGKTPKDSTPHVFFAWGDESGDDVKFAKLAYSSGSWSQGAERTIDTGTTSPGAVLCAFDGTRVVLATRTGGVRCFERDAADTTTTTLSPPTNTLGSMSLSVDGATGDIYLVGEDGTDDDPVYVRYDRDTGTWGSWTVIEEESALGGTGTVVSRRIIPNGLDQLDVGWIAGDDQTIRYEAAVSLNQPPDAPIQTNPVSGATIDRTVDHRFQWDFSDPDSGDSQSKFDLQIREQGTTVLDVDETSETTSERYDLPGGTLAAGDYEWRVRTYDAQGEVGPWSGWEPFVAAAPPSGPTITDPTSGSTISTETYTVQWSAAEQDDYQLRRVADDAGSPDTATVHFDTGTVSSATTRSLDVEFPTNGRWEHVQVRVRRDGLWSDWASNRVEVSYTPPATPTVAVVENGPTGAIGVTIDNGDWPVTVSEVAYSGTGDGTMTGPTATDGTTDSHSWEAVCVATATDGGTFDVKVDGTVVGQATVGTQFTHEGLSFTINDGATDFALGDTFTWSTTAVKVTSNEVWRRVTADGGDGIRIATGVANGGTHTDWAVSSGVEYGYRIKARGDNETTAWGAWTEEPSSEVGYFGGAFE